MRSTIEASAEVLQYCAFRNKTAERYSVILMQLGQWIGQSELDDNLSVLEVQPSLCPEEWL
jgi:hypothetical protein